MKRYFIYLAYNGKNYCGWQIQPNGITVQQSLEQSLSTLLRVPVSITGAGRTDTGVHARLMVAHFDVEMPDPDTEALTERLNGILPPDIAVDRILPVRPDAHARFDALSRTYQYHITYRKDPFEREFLYRVKKPLDYRRMNEAARILFEYSDFTSFSKLHTDTKTNICRILKAEWRLEACDRLVFTIQADRFLRNMVRSIVGTLIEVGNGKLSPEGFRAVIESENRAKAGTSVPAHALFLTDIEYPETVFENENKNKNEYI
ncbi:MAG: tRNA pseudouridine(38-40) synthase TruA [Dysgonamonadaceae bacterium]|jgi:tRNA pseudouridine38-40 synthase|nr:tRNA pseudouridine(38-40) synthase TruA [Dysgonamonadaceae bacterium]